MIFQGFVGPTYNLPAKTFDVQRSVNLYPMASEVGTSKSVTSLASCAGYSSYVDVLTGPIRGAKTTANGRGWAIGGGFLYEVTGLNLYTNRGSLLTTSGTVSIAENGTQIMIVDGQYGYIFNMDTNVFEQIVDPDFPICDTVTFQDGYFIVNQSGTPNYFISALYDGLSWDVLDFSNAITNPDNLVAVLSNMGNLWLFGDRSVEVHQNTGAAQFPFELIEGAIIQTGCAAAFTVQPFDNSIAWLGVDEQGRGVVWRATGYQAMRMSNQSIEAKIAESSDFTDSYAYTYHEQGHVFYVLQIRGLNTTLVYDGSTNQWHERTFFNEDANETERHRGACHFFFDQKNLIGDRETGKIYQQSLSIYDHNGVQMQRIRVSPHINNERKLISFASLELDCENGAGLQTGQGSDPQVVMSYSDDGGRTWSNERQVSLGKAGKYQSRVRWTRLGQARDRVFQVKYSEPTFFQINEAYINNV